MSEMAQEIYRTHTCGELTERNLNETIRLAGWVDTIRDHGGVAFLDLRDQYGVTQVVVHDDALLKDLHRETAITVSGKVVARDEETVNPKIPTGRLEVLADALEVLGPCVPNLPFDVQDSTDTREEVRLKYRFLDLRNPRVHDNILFRSKVVSFLRRKMEALGERMNLIAKDRFELCYITDFPMYEKNEEGKLDFTHNPFSMPQGGLEALETMNPLEIKAYQYDIVCNGVELSSGAVRNHRPDIMVKAFALAGYTAEDVEARFGALYHAFQYGAPPHAGMAPGVDRMLMLLRDEENIREVIAFPMNANAQDLLLGAPGEVTEQQLREVHIKLRRPLENRV